MTGKPGRCKVCDHKKSADIDKALRAGEHITELAKKYKISRSTLSKHKKEHMGKVLNVAGRKGLICIEELLIQLTENMKFMRKMMYACDDWLKDPEDPDKYFIGERSSEIEITYLEKNEETGRYNQVPKKATLQEIIDANDAEGHYMIMKLQSTASDPRELLLKSVNKLEKSVEIVMKIAQSDKENTFKNKAMDDLSGSKVKSITMEEEMKILTKRVTVAYQAEDSDSLMKLTGMDQL